MSNQNFSHFPDVRFVVAISVGILLLSSCSSVVPVPTLDNNQIATAAFQTAQVINLQTQAASNPTLVPSSTATSAATATESPSPTSTGFAIPVTGADCIPDNPPQTGIVVDVVDGDTIKVLLDEDGLTYSVRYIGMDTPENTSQVEYFGPDATAKNSGYVYGKTVTLIKDVSETDRYGRLLRYVIAEDLFVNYELVAQGYANTASYPPDIACVSTFQIAEGEAFALKRGFWSAPPTPTQRIIFPLPSPTLKESTSGSGGNAPCNCSGLDLDCADFGSHASAQSCFNYCRSAGFGDVFRLDRDSDGSACETLP